METNNLFKKALTLCLSLMLIAVFNVSVKATDYYMATNGSNSNAGTLVAPFATIDKFFDVCASGDDLYIRGGTYIGQSTHVWKSGKADNPIVIKNYPDEVPIFDGDYHDHQTTGPNMLFYSDDGTWNKNGVSFISYITIEGLIIRNYGQSGINLGGNYTETDRTQRCDHITVRNCVVDYIEQNGIGFAMSNNILVENCMVSRTGFGKYSWSSGINFYNMTGSNNVVRNCISFHHIDVSYHHTDGNGFILDIYPKELHDLGSGVTLENNLFFENGGVGVAITRSGNLNMNNNTLYENGKDPLYEGYGRGIYFWRDNDIGQFPNINMRNNIIYQSSGLGMEQNTKFNGGTITNNVISTFENINYPNFTDPATRDFTLKTSSISVDAGTSTDVPSTAMVFDNAVIKTETANQPVAWYHLAPDFDYIISKKGLANCISTTTRPKGGGYDQGCFENLNTKTTVAATGVSILPATVSIAAGTLTQLTASFIPADASNQNVTWSSSNKAIAVINRNTGMLGASSVGTATITVTSKDGNYTGTRTVTVKASDNLGERVNNGGFESTNLTGWDYSNSGCTKVADNQNAGSFALRVKAGYIDQMLNLKTNTNYEFKCWSKVTKGFVYVGIVDDENGTPLYVLSPNSVGNTYVLYNKTFNTGWASRWKLYLWNDGANDAYVDDISVLEVGNTTNIIETNNTSSQKLEIYPNPASSVLNFKNIPENAFINIYDVQGRAMNVRLVNNSMDILGLYNGTYIIHVVGDGNNVIKLFIKQ
jgi:uncharacterized protein YjdB